MCWRMWSVLHRLRKIKCYGCQISINQHLTGRDKIFFLLLLATSLFIIWLYMVPSFVFISFVHFYLLCCISTKGTINYSRNELNSIKHSVISTMNSIHFSNHRSTSIQQWLHFDSSSLKQSMNTIKMMIIDFEIAHNSGKNNCKEEWNEIGKDMRTNTTP